MSEPEEAYKSLTPVGKNSNVSIGLRSEIKDSPNPIENTYQTTDMPESVLNPSKNYSKISSDV